MKVTFQVERSGTTRMMVLHPVGMNGNLLIDDGEHWLVDSPGKEKASQLVSARVFMPQPEDQLRLLEGNYRLSFRERETIADRSVYVVQAEPKRDELQRRLLYIDREKKTLLRYEIVHSRQRVERTLDTLRVTYREPRPIEPYNSEVEESWSPIAISSDRHARTHAGFSPRVPEDLPLGFRVQARQMLNRELRASVAIRLSDGLAGVTIHQWNPDRFEDGEAFSETDAVDRWGIHYLVQGDVPEAVEKRLLEAFVAAGGGPK
jgi:negative regulator of sigma E activity